MNFSVLLGSWETPQRVTESLDKPSKCRSVAFRRNQEIKKVSKFNFTVARNLDSKITIQSTRQNSLSH